jgi:hypothetical protein
MHEAEEFAAKTEIIKSQHTGLWLSSAPVDAICAERDTETGELVISVKFADNSQIHFTGPQITWSEI